MTCRERILSNDYADGVVDFPVENFIGPESDACFIPLDDRYSAVYQNREYVPDLTESIYQYRYVPHLYGLMQVEGGGNQAPFDPTFLVDSGIRQLQGQPLNLTGRGTIIAIIDTGERVIIMSS